MAVDGAKPADVDMLQVGTSTPPETLRHDEKFEEKWFNEKQVIIKKSTFQIE
jgi:hypothetical protein